MGEQAHSVFEVQPGLQIIGSSCKYALDVTGFMTAEVELTIAATQGGAEPDTITVHQHVGKGGGRMHNQMFVKGLGKGQMFVKGLGKGKGKGGVFQDP